MKNYEEISPSNWKNEVEKLIIELETYLNKVERIVAESHKIETNIRIIKNKGTLQYYLFNEKTQKAQYISKNEIDSIKEIAQLNYYRKSIPKIKKRNRISKKYIRKV